MAIAELIEREELKQGLGTYWYLGLDSLVWHKRDAGKAAEDGVWRPPGAKPKTKKK